MAERPAPARHRIFGLPVDRVDLHGAVRWVKAAAKSRQKTWVLSVNPLTVMLARKDPQLQKNLATAGLCLPDGIGTVWALRRLHGVHASRVAGIELLEALFPVPGLRYFFLGSAPGVATAAAQAVRQRFPHVKIAGEHHGYFSPGGEASLIKEIARARPSVLVVCLGQPRQELWLLRHWKKLPACVVLPLGGSLDVLSGRLSRAPGWTQKFGLEWLYRTLREPRRAARLFPLAIFALKTLFSGGSRPEKP